MILATPFSSAYWLRSRSFDRTLSSSLHPAGGADQKISGEIRSEDGATDFGYPFAPLNSEKAMLEFVPGPGRQSEQPDRRSKGGLIQPRGTWAVAAIQNKGMVEGQRECRRRSKCDLC